MGNDKTAYVENLEKRIVELEKELSNKPKKGFK
jgi:hypothetical protein